MQEVLRKSGDSAMSSCETTLFTLVRMKQIHRYRLLWAGLVIALAWSVCRAEFAAPAEGPVAFRRDLVPLDSGAMSALSRHLTLLARTQPIASPAEQRTVAQLLALGQALDPGNGACRDLILACSKARHTPLKDPGSRNKSIEKIRELTNWLKSPEAGKHGQPLAACLEDILAAATTGKQANETGAWAGWVPELAAYEPKPKPPEVKPVAPPPPTPVPSSPPPPKIKLAQASVSTLAWKRTGEGMTSLWSTVDTSLTMTASLMENPANEFSIQIGPIGGPLDRTAKTIRTLLKKHHGDLPPGICVQISCKEFTSSAEAATALPSSASAAVLASAAITGDKPNAIILGRVDETGNLTLTRTFWNQLFSLQSGKGKRLVIPAAAADILPSLLALNKSDYFMDYEVLVARNFQELLELTANQPPKHVVEASAKFQAIRERQGNENVRAYVANHYVRQRLSELAQQAPYHASAAMLIMQGSGRRPSQISRIALTGELMRACNSLAWIPNSSWQELDKWNQPQFENALVAYRKNIEELSDKVSKSDKDLIGVADALIPQVREIERAIRDRGSYDAKMWAMWQARVSFIAPFRAFEKTLENEAKKLIQE